MRNAGMFTTMRVSVGTALGPLSITGSLVSASFLAASAEGAGPFDGVGLLSVSADWPLSKQLERQTVSKINARVRGSLCVIVSNLSAGPAVVAMRLATHPACVQPQTRRLKPNPRYV